MPVAKSIRAEPLPEKNTRQKAQNQAKVIHIITKLELGGAQENTIWTVKHLNREKFYPLLWSGPGGILTEEVKSELKEDFCLIPSLTREISPKNDLLALIWLWKKLREEKKQCQRMRIIIHTHSSKAGILGRWAGVLARVPVIIHSYHGFGFNDFQPRVIRSGYILIEKITGWITDRFIFVSKANMEKAKKLGIGKPAQYNLIRSGIEIKQFQPKPLFDREAKRKELGVDAGGKVVSMVACLKRQKSPLDFAKVAHLVLKEAPESWFLVAGDGELRPELEKLVEELGIKERFKLLGWRRDVPEIMWASDLLVLTSLWEGLPRVYPQAMSAGLAIVGTRVDGAEEAVIGGGNGYLLAPGDVSGIAERIIELLKDDEKRKTMAEKGKELVAEFDIYKMVKDQEKLYERILKEKLLWS